MKTVYVVTKLDFLNPDSYPDIDVKVYEESSKAFLDYSTTINPYINGPYEVDTTMSDNYRETIINLDKDYTTFKIIKFEEQQIIE